MGVGVHDPLDNRVVRVVAVQKPQTLHGPALVLDLARAEVIPAREATLAEDRLDAGDVTLEGLLDTLAPLAEADAERTVGVLALRPVRSSGLEAREVVLGHPPRLLAVRAAESGELLADGHLVGVLLGFFRDLHHRTVVDGGLDHRIDHFRIAVEIIHQLCGNLVRELSERCPHHTTNQLEQVFHVDTLFLSYVVDTLSLRTTRSERFSLLKTTY